VKTYPFYIAFSIVLHLAVPSLVIATTPQIDSIDRLWPIDSPLDRLQPHRPQLPRRDPGNYYGQFLATCEFLTRMQESDPEDANFGGLHEGEDNALWAIVETDNTQEAIRVWSLYGLLFDDPDRYRANIEAAWLYCTRFPAWRESPPGQFYALHNAGWGIMAEMAYREVYGNDRLEYAIQCADHLVEFTPEFTPDHADRLMPLVAGWAAGTLFLFAENINNDDYRNAALEIATDVIGWIDARPARLNANEIWALCGGTAMWGVLNSLGFDRPDDTREWAVSRLEQMDIFAGRGEWNNSWNIWYAHAWWSAFQLTGNREYVSNAIAIVDSLIAQDHDHDGGIPATIGDRDNRDQSWVSAYTAWMGLYNNLDQLPQIDAAVLGLLSPRLNRPYPAGEGLRLSVSLVSEGAQERLIVPFRLTGALEVEDRFVIEGWNPAEVILHETWEIPAPGSHNFELVLLHEEDADRSDDTLRWRIEALPTAEVQVSALNERDQSIELMARFYHTALDSTEPPVEIHVPPGNFGSGRMMTGRYRVELDPVFPYVSRVIEDYEVRAGEVNSMSLRFEQPPILLVDNDSATTFSPFYESSLDAAGYPFIRWTRLTGGSIASLTTGFQAIIYFTGNRRTGTVPSDDRAELAAFHRGGGHVFVTGQNVVDDLHDSQFMSNFLHSRRVADSTGRRQVTGVAGDDLFEGMNFLLVGNRGANNQASTAAVSPVNGGVACAFYTGTHDSVAAVRWTQPSGAKGLFLAFGFEGISGQGGTTSRESALSSIMDWFGIEAGVGDHPGPSPYPTNWRLVSIWPNPFNGRLSIHIEGHIPTSSKIQIFDLAGRIVEQLPLNNPGLLNWEAKDKSGRLLPNGPYFLSIPDMASGRSSTKRVVLVK